MCSERVESGTWQTSSRYPWPLEKAQGPEPVISLNALAHFNPPTQRVDGQMRRDNG